MYQTLLFKLAYIFFKNASHTVTPGPTGETMGFEQTTSPLQAQSLHSTLTGNVMDKIVKIEGGY